MGEKKSEKEGKTTIEQVVQINAAAKHTVFVWQAADATFSQ